MSTNKNLKGLCVPYTCSWLTIIRLSALKHTKQVVFSTILLCRIWNGCWMDLSCFIQSCQHIVTSCKHSAGLKQTVFKTSHTHTYTHALTHSKHTNMHTARLSSVPASCCSILLSSALQITVTAELIATIHLILLGKCDGSVTSTVTPQPETQTHILFLIPLQRGLFFIYLY